MTAGSAVIPRTLEGDRAEHGVDGLVPVGDEFRLVAGPAVHPRAAVAGVPPEQVFQQPAAQPGHRGPDRQLHRVQAAAGSQRARRQAGQAPYLGGDLRRERLAEPPLSPAGAAGGSPAAGVTGLASQIASLTSTICSLSTANCL
jgi:hypothetical protein